MKGNKKLRRKYKKSEVRITGETSSHTVRTNRKSNDDILYGTCEIAHWFPMSTLKGD